MRNAPKWVSVWTNTDYVAAVATMYLTPTQLHFDSEDES
jgi:hypothetical protein